ncbi:hypothetical protein Q4575_13155 [Psychrosphaera sp. 1_MG-2023]|uniref:hypothetical protein n=1 Tax=Psychrosphaera sp. 1_MG-2023 TaxID=3062643 RepID=UPI0026E449A3|nr:hypothetical protein [Psychrosphaera sp. 1_MG-2023]MDO6720359.1 hypothetical protein [Psychrosphaera sp. 1_MG-2023]
MANIFKKQYVYRVIGVSIATFFNVGHAAEIDFKPAVEINYIHVLDTEISQFNFSNHDVLTASPSFTLAGRSPNWQGSVTADHTQIKQIDDGFDDASYSNFAINNLLNMYKGRVNLTVNASRKNTNIDSSFGTVSDPIFGQSEYVDVDSVNSRLTLSTSSKSVWQNSLSLGVSKTIFDESQITDTTATTSNIVNGTTKTASASLGYGQRANQVRGALQASMSRTDRENRGEQDSISMYANIGVPIWRTIDLVLTGSKFKNLIENSVLDDEDLESESYGAGLAWRFGQRSNIEVTRNKETRGQDDEYTGYKLEFYPSARTSLSYEKSQRFYGESHAFRLQHQAKRWGMNINYDETLGSQTRFNRIEVSLGDFLCPADAATQDDCQPLAELPDAIDDGEFVAEFFQPEFSLDELVTLSKTGTASVNYRMKKANISFTYNRGETEYLETNAVRETSSRTFNYDHTMSRRNSFAISLSDSDSTEQGTGVSREGYKVDVSFKRKLTRKALGTIAFKRISNTTSTGQQDRRDTRVELTYRYAF